MIIDTVNTHIEDNRQTVEWPSRRGIPTAPGACLVSVVGKTGT